MQYTDMSYAGELMGFLARSLAASQGRSMVCHWQDRGRRNHQTWYQRQSPIHRCLDRDGLGSDRLDSSPLLTDHPFQLISFIAAKIFSAPGSTHLLLLQSNSRKIVVADLEGSHRATENASVDMEVFARLVISFP